MWYIKYLGTPWKQDDNPPHSYNCGSLVRQIYKDELGVDSPVIQVSCTGHKVNVRAIEDYFENEGFYQIEEGEKVTFDVVKMFAGGRSNHVGIVCGDNILHCLEGVGVTMDSMFILKNTYEMEFWRYNEPS